jgi:hypothetical protein
MPPNHNNGAPRAATNEVIETGSLRLSSESSGRRLLFFLHETAPSLTGNVPTWRLKLAARPKTNQSARLRRSLVWPTGPTQSSARDLLERLRAHVTSIHNNIHTVSKNNSISSFQDKNAKNEHLKSRNDLTHKGCLPGLFETVDTILVFPH